MSGSKDIDPPAFGQEIVRTEQDVIEGRVGNGSALSLEELHDAQQRRKVLRVKSKDEVEEAYMRGVQDALTPAGRFVGDLIDQGQSVLDKYKTEGKISNAEIAILKMGHKAAEDVANRQLGKAVSKSESKTETSILGAILNVSRDDNQ